MGAGKSGFSRGGQGKGRGGVVFRNQNYVLGSSLPLFFFGRSNTAGSVYTLGFGLESQIAGVWWFSFKQETWENGVKRGCGRLFLFLGRVTICEWPRNPQKDIMKQRLG